MHPQPLVVELWEPDRGDIPCPRDHLAEQHPVVGPAVLAAELVDLEPRGRVEFQQIGRESRADHPVADHDEPGHALLPAGLAEPSAALTSTAHTLTSGIPEIGSAASLVTRFTLPDPPNGRA